MKTVSVVVQTTRGHLVEPVTTHIQDIQPALRPGPAVTESPFLLSRVLCCCPAGSWTLWGCSQPWPWCRASSWARCGPERTGLSSTTLRGRTPRRSWSPSWSPATSSSLCWGASWCLCLQSLCLWLVSSRWYRWAMTLVALGREF